jgi:hypothetical protein
MTFTFTITIIWIALPIIITLISYLCGIIWVKKTPNKQLEMSGVLYGLVFVSATIVSLLSWVFYLVIMIILQ